MVVEALAFPVALWADLPAPSSLLVRTASGRTAWLSASRTRLAAALRDCEAAFGPNEYEAAVAAILEARATDADLDGWIDAKLGAPGWVLTTARAFAGAVGFYNGARVLPHLLGSVTWGVALECCRLEVVDVVVEQQAAPRSSEVAAEELAQL